MSLVLFAVGALGAVIGLALIAFGIPNTEFSVGSTMILAGTTMLTGGVIVVGLGAVVAQLRQLSETSALRQQPRGGRSGNTDVASGEGSVAFPPRPKAPALAPATAPIFPPAEDATSGTIFGREPLPELLTPKAGSRDWDAQPPFPSASEQEETPPESEPRFSVGATDDSNAPSAMPERHPETISRVTSPERSGSPGIFDGMWTPENRQAADKDQPDFPKPADPPEPRAAEPVKGPAETWKPQPFIPPAPARAESRPPRGAFSMPTQAPMPMPTPMPMRDEAAPPPAAEEKPTAAVLKSGNVDGMGYTLYVDGSIEAELPSGTLRFASIAELRSHLEKNS